MKKEGGNKSIISRIRKRDGRIVLFDQERITNAIFKAAQAVGGTDKERAKKLSDQVVRVLEERFGADITPTVEQIQDIVEKTLIENGHATTAKAFILYREQRRKLREMAMLTEPIGIVEGYIRQNDWKVNENSNMTYSLQGLNSHISNAIISKYWIEKLYTPRIREAYEKGDIHIHDLGTLGCYCVGWDLKDLLLSGFKGVSGKVESKPPKHFRTALGQAVNFFYTLQGEAAGAMAFSNFDTLLAPFIAYDKLTYAEIKQAIQEFMFNMNVPTRTGFQCLSEDTEILTIDGWKRYDEIEKGTMIKTLNIKKMIIEDKKVKSVFKKPYKGVMYNLKNRIQDQLISPGHRIVRKKFNTTHYVLEPIEDVLKLKSPIVTLVATDNLKEDASISDEQIKLMAWVITEGSVEKRSRHGSCYRVSIYQSAIKNKSNYEEIKLLLNHFKLNYSEYTQHGLGSPVQRIRLNADSSRVIHNWLSKENVKFIPNQFLNMSQRQSKLFVDIFIKAEGFEGCKIATSDIDILNDLQAIVANAGYGSTVLKREPTIGTKPIYVLRLIKHKETYIKRIVKVDYNGIIWCPNTENETVIARRNGKVFITGNTPFSNITLDLKVPDFMKEEHVIIGGNLMEKKYKHFQREMDLFNEILAEVILEGDSKNRVFTFPIPTYNITKDFEWDNNAYDNIWEMTAKYGVPYFSNFINSDMKPDDARSMCCRLKLDQRELRKRGGGLFGSNPLTGSLGVVTINMARIGYLSKTEEEFFERLSNLMDISKESLEIKRKVLEDFTEQNLYPYSKFYLRNMKASTGLYWKNHFSTIGLLGMNEALLNFMQKDIASEEGRKFAIKVLDFMRKKISEYQQEIGNIYNLEATPGEGSLAPEEKVLISSSDPRLTEIGPLIDGFLEKNRDRIHKIEDTEILPLKQGTLYTYGFSRKTNKIKKYPVTSVIRHKGRSMYEIKTRLGKKVKVTGQHSVFTLNKQGDIEQIKVDKLRQGSYIAVPKRINIQPVNTKFNLIERFKSSPLKNRFYLKTSKEFIEALVNRKQIKDWTRKYYKTEYRTIKSTWKKRCVIPLRLIYDNNIKLNLKVLQKSKIIYRSTKSTKPINAQIRINHDLGFVLGGLLSEGWLGKRPSFYNTNEEYVKKFTQACDTIFGEGSYSLCLKKREKEGRKPMYTVTLSKVIGLVLKDVMQLKGLSGEKSVPSFVYASKDETIKGLLKAFTLGDGTFYSKESKGNYNIRLYTKSKDLVNGLNLLLLRLGIVAKLKKDNKSKTNPNWADGYVLEISGVEYLKKYFKLILGKKFNKKITNSGKETVPEMPKIIKNILKKHKIKLKEVGIDKDSFNRNVRKNSISVHYLKRIITQISSKLKNAEIESLKRIVDSDIFWDKITSIEKVSTPKYVYDFEVNVNGDTVENFLGGDCLICLHNTTYRFAKKDKEIYPDIIVANEKAYQERKAAPFYTNSTQLHVDYTDDIFEALMLQDEIQTKYNGGTVIHCFLGEKISSVEATKALVRKIAENFKIPYFTLTPTFSICPKHGYLVGEHEYCPKCDEEIDYKEVK